MHYMRTWLRFAHLSAAQFLTNRIDSLTYLLGKLARFGFFLLLIFALFQHTDNVAGYGPYEFLLFFLVYNFLDVAVQVFFRGLYLLKTMVRTGNFDFLLIKPVGVLFQVMSRLIDPLDVLFMIPITGLLIWNITLLPVAITASSVLLFCFFCSLGFLILTGFHVLSAAFIVIFVDADNIIWSYRYLLALGRFPPELFASGFALFFTVIIPIFVVTAFPAKALLGLMSFGWGMFATAIALGFFAFSLWMWHLSLKKYSSASS